jgi:hypothetical protein
MCVGSCIIGAGAGGLQLARFLQEARLSYVVLEKARGAGDFFRHLYGRLRILVCIVLWSIVLVFPTGFLLFFLSLCDLINIFG